MSASASARRADQRGRADPRRIGDRQGTGRRGHSLQQFSRGGPLVKVHCAASHTGSLESELFGQENGALPGPLCGRTGWIDEAEGGTIFLDEIADLSLSIQVGLLRFLQEREFERVGGDRTLRADVRVVAATARNLEACVEAGTFRQDLYYRINVFPIALPPTSPMPDVSETASPGSLTVRVQLLERDMLVNALKATQGNVAAAARRLGITPRMIRYKLKKLGIDSRGSFRKRRAAARSRPLVRRRLVLLLPADVESRQIDAAAQLFLQEPQPRLHAVHLPLQDGEQAAIRVLRPRPRHARIAKVPRQGGEQIERVLSPIGQGDPPFLFAEEDRLFRFAAVLAIEFAADVDHVGEVDQPDLAADRENPLPPIGAVDVVAGDGVQAAVVAEAIAAEGFELIEEDSLGRGARGAIFGFALEDFQADAEVELSLRPLALADHVGSETG